MNETKRENYNDYIFPKIVCVFSFERILFSVIVRNGTRLTEGGEREKKRRDEKG